MYMKTDITYGTTSVLIINKILYFGEYLYY
jgi:hypothetical protein